ncbi:hypothetical protein BJ508DRAFT_310507 [Ascobolus immersus RN42]|uniref:Uncharacterized protein n=1 Tax=Ascobolus immersus RN42 TaxID=1160509 RepID=A0A3N4HV21_ASCIM|nr:hypothetical protein BJ508DRAFT_310507 [Ascobolus immersus RN42]
MDATAYTYAHNPTTEASFACGEEKKDVRAPHICIRLSERQLSKGNSRLLTGMLLKGENCLCTRDRDTLAHSHTSENLVLRGRFTSILRGARDLLEDQDIYEIRGRQSTGIKSGQTKRTHLRDMTLRTRQSTKRKHNVVVSVVWSRIEIRTQKKHITDASTIHKNIHVHVVQNEDGIANGQVTSVVQFEKGRMPWIFNYRQEREHSRSSESEVSVPLSNKRVQRHKNQRLTKTMHASAHKNAGDNAREDYTRCKLASVDDLAFQTTYG